MRILITGTSNGIGKAIAEKFLMNGHEVFGIDICAATIKNKRYKHFQTDILFGKLPEICDVEILINNAGTQTEINNKNIGESEIGNRLGDIDTNLKGTIRVTEKYAFQQKIKSVLFVASASASTGSEFPEYVASKGGVVAYMKNVALRMAEFGATSNSLSPGGVTTALNKHVTEDAELWQQIMNETLLPKWATPEEIAEWSYFVTTVNKSMTAQDILIDNGEAAKSNFVW